MVGWRYAAAAAMVALCAGCAGSSAAPAVMPAAAGVAPAATTTALGIVLDAKSQGPVVSADLYGASHDTWFDFTQPFVNPSLRATGIHLVRWPGGSESDAYHWENGGSVCDNQGYITKNATFDNLMRDLADPSNIDVAITLNYGSNPACNGGGLPSEAATWVAYAKSKGYDTRYWTVGNEVYGSWEYDLHAHPHDPVTYSDAVRDGYYPAVKRADPNAKLGIVVDAPDDTAWNGVVLKRSGRFDFVELHYYPQYDKDDDAFLLGAAIDAFATDLKGLRAEMTAAGVSTATPIYLGEFNNDAGAEGKQSVSIVNGLYLGQTIAVAAGQGVAMATWWLANGSCDVKGGDYAKSLYGWQHFGSYALFSDGLPNSYEGCAHTPTIAGGTPFPTARVMALYRQTVPPGSAVRRTLVLYFTGGHTSKPKVRAFGYALSGGGYALTMFNDTLSTVAVTASVDGAAKTAYAATLSVYGAEQYDESRHGRWIGPASRSLGSVKPGKIVLTLPPYSLTALTLR